MPLGSRDQGTPPGGVPSTTWLSGGVPSSLPGGVPSSVPGGVPSSSLPGVVPPVPCPFSWGDLLPSPPSGHSPASFLRPAAELGGISSPLGPADAAGTPYESDTEFTWSSTGRGKDVKAMKFSARLTAKGSALDAAVSGVSNGCTVPIKRTRREKWESQKILRAIVSRVTCRFTRAKPA